MLVERQRKRRMEEVGKGREGKINVFGKARWGNEWR